LTKVIPNHLPPPVVPRPARVVMSVVLTSGFTIRTASAVCGAPYRHPVVGAYAIPHHFCASAPRPAILAVSATLVAGSTTKTESAVSGAAYSFCVEVAYAMPRHLFARAALVELDPKPSSVVVSTLARSCPIESANASSEAVRSPTLCPLPPVAQISVPQRCVQAAVRVARPGLRIRCRACSGHSVQPAVRRAA